MWFFLTGQRGCSRESEDSLHSLWKIPAAVTLRYLSIFFPGSILSGGSASSIYGGRGQKRQGVRGIIMIQALSLLCICICTSVFKIQAANCKSVCRVLFWCPGISPQNPNNVLLGVLNIQPGCCFLTPKKQEVEDHKWLGMATEDKNMSLDAPNKHENKIGNFCS